VGEKKPAKLLLTEAQRDELVQRFKDEYSGRLDQGSRHQEEAYRICA